MVTAIFVESEKKRFKMKIGVSLVLIREEKVLLIKRFNTGIGDGLHVLPMGCVDEPETAQEALVRETKEEVNLNLVPSSLELVHTMHRVHHMPDGASFKQIDLFFQSKYFTGEIKNMEPHKCDEVEFYDLNALPETTESFVRQALSCIHKGISYSEIGWES